MQQHWFRMHLPICSSAFVVAARLNKLKQRWILCCRTPSFQMLLMLLCNQ
jgi:hypothetical protein